MLNWLRNKMERGQAIIEYMPTIAGAMALAMLAGIYIGGGVTQSYCKVVDAFTDPPSVCVDDEGGGVQDDVTDADQPPGDENTTEDSAVCVYTLDSAEGLSPVEWSQSVSPGDSDTLRVAVSNVEEPLAWSLLRKFPNDPSSTDTEVQNGVFAEDGDYEIGVTYPAEGEWGPSSSDGLGRYDVQYTLNVVDDCDSVAWDRWYVGDAAADMAIGITHDVSPIMSNGETLTYTVTVTNNGPNNAEVVEGQGTIVSLPAPSDVTVISATPSQGTCDTEIVCDLGALPQGSSATITVVTTVTDSVVCELTGTSTVSAAYPDDPDLGNNQATTVPWCDSVCEMNVTGFSLVDSTGAVTALTNGAEIEIASGETFNVVANVTGTVSSVVFNVNGSEFSTANGAPYAIEDWAMTPGSSYTVEAIPYTQANATGETCSALSVNFSVVAEAVEPPGGITDPDQPTGDPYPTCPDSHPTLIAEYDHYATPENYKLALKWGSATRQSHTYTFSLLGDYDTILLSRGAIGHPEVGCPEANDPFCREPNQDNEHWKVSVDGEEEALFRDNYALDHVYLTYPDVQVGVLSAGSHTITIEHAGLLDMPTNSTGPSVGAYIAVCVNDTN